MTPTVATALVAAPAGQVSGSVLSPLDASASCSAPRSRRSSFSDARSCSGTGPPSTGSTCSALSTARPTRRSPRSARRSALRVPSDYLAVVASKVGSSHGLARPRDGEHPMTPSTTTPPIHRVLRTRATGGVRTGSPVVKRPDNTTDTRSIGGRLLTTGER